MLGNMRNQDYAKTEIVGVVVDNKDPLMARRLRIRVPVVHDGVPNAQIPWAVCGSVGGRGPLPNASRVEIPHIGADVLVKFQQGDPQNPMYTGGVSSARTVPELFRTNYPERNGWLIPIGTYFYVDEVEKVLKVHHQGTIITIADSGHVTILAPANILVDSPHVRFTGQVEINGHTTVHQGISGEGDVVLDTYSLKGHHHVEQGDGAPTTAARP